MRITCAHLLACLILAVLATSSVEAQVDDRFLNGYVSAILEREFNAKPESLSVESGAVRVKINLAESERDKLKAALSSIEGVRSVDVLEGAAVAQAAAAPPGQPTPPAGKQPPTHGWIWLPGKPAFRSLIADPRWPHFSAEYHYYIDDKELGDVASANFGESFPLLQYKTDGGSTWEVGLHAGVFAIFNMDADSFDLINADYLAGLPVTYAWKNLSVMGRVYHQSSHLGDEYLLRNRVQRVNLSYEAIDLLLSYELPWGFRTYAGAGYLMRVEPSSIKRWSTQGGFEFVGPNLREDESVGLRPVAAIDVQNRQEGGWDTNLSPRFGIRLDRPSSTRNLQFLIEYFQGKSPNGQFYERNIRYIGVGAHLGF